MSTGLITLILVAGHILLHGYFTPVLIAAFAWELKEYRSQPMLSTSDLSPSRLKHARFIANQSVFIPCLFAGLAFALLSAGVHVGWVRWLTIPVLGFDTPWLSQNTEVSAGKMNSLLAGYIGYFYGGLLSIFYRRTIAVGIMDWVHSKAPQAAPNYGFTDRSAWLFCIIGFVLADFCVGIIAHHVFLLTPSRRWFLIHCFLILPSAPAVSIWMAAFGLNFTSSFWSKMK
jgi:hypothetical protein